MNSQAKRLVFSSDLRHQGGEQVWNYAPVGEKIPIVRRSFRLIHIDAHNQYRYNLFILRIILTNNLKPDTNSNTYQRQN